MIKIKKFIRVIIIISIIYLIFKYNSIIKNTCIYSVNLFIENVFPTLFIMFILSDVLINLNIINNVKVLSLILPMITGCPTNIFIIKELLNNKYIDLNNALVLIKCNYYVNPLFLYTILRLSFNSYITIKLILITYITNLVIYVINKDKLSILKNIINNNINNIFTIIPKSISKVKDMLLIVLGSITLYLIISNIISNIIYIDTNIYILFKGLLEITQGLSILYNIDNLYIKEIIALTIISFGGLSIHSQVSSILDNTILYRHFLIGRILSVVISITIYIVILIIEIFI